MDDDRLAQLLHDAVQESPPATFDADDVLTESRRLTARRRSLTRNATMGGLVLVAAGLLTGLGVVGFGSFGHTVNSSAGSSNSVEGLADPSPTSNEFHPNSRPRGGPEAQFDVPVSPSMQGDGGTGSAGHMTGGTPGGCGSTDGELAVALAGELPSVGDPQPATVPSADCPSGTTSAAAVSINDHGAPGVIIALIRPASAPAVQVAGGVGHAASSPTQRNTVVTVLSQPQPAGGPIPFQTQLSTIAQHLATHF
ncbi:MAG TPA: hypothetical protein VGM75_05250 [Pseudonocardiaceae bacterium]